jgi:hypothetical protein
MAITTNLDHSFEHQTGRTTKHMVELPSTVAEAEKQIIVIDCMDGRVTYTAGNKQKESCADEDFYKSRIAQYKEIIALLQQANSLYSQSTAALLEINK